MDYTISLLGTTGSTSNQPIWTLPHGARPESDLYFTAESDVGPVTVTVMADGSILISDVTEWTRLDRITFTAAHI
jgi:hypothetical protein